MSFATHVITVCRQREAVCSRFTLYMHRFSELIIILQGMLGVCLHHVAQLVLSPSLNKERYVWYNIRSHCTYVYGKDILCKFNSLEAHL